MIRALPFPKTTDTKKIRARLQGQSPVLRADTRMALQSPRSSTGDRSVRHPQLAKRRGYFKGHSLEMYRLKGQSPK